MSISPNTLEPLIGPSFNQILSELDIIYPQTNANPSDKIEDIMYRSGQRSIIDWIRERVNED